MLLLPSWSSCKCSLSFAPPFPPSLLPSLLTSFPSHSKGLLAFASRPCTLSLYLNRRSYPTRIPSHHVLHLSSASHPVTHSHAAAYPPPHHSRPASIPSIPTTKIIPTSHPSEQARTLRMARLDGGFERRDSFPILLVGIGAVGKQQPHRLGVAVESRVVKGSSTPSLTHSIGRRAQAEQRRHLGGLTPGCGEA